MGPGWGRLSHGALGNLAGSKDNGSLVSKWAVGSRKVLFHATGGA